MYLFISSTPGVIRPCFCYKLSLFFEIQTDIWIAWPSGQLVCPKRQILQYALYCIGKGHSALTQISRVCQHGPNKAEKKKMLEFCSCFVAVAFIISSDNIVLYSAIAVIFLEKEPEDIKKSLNFVSGEIANLSKQRNYLVEELVKEIW